MSFIGHISTVLLHDYALEVIMFWQYTIFNEYLETIILYFSDLCQLQANCATNTN